MNQEDIKVELERIVNPLNDEDALILKDSALDVIEQQEATITGLQRKFAWGYHRAERIMKKLESLGIVSHGEAYNPRKVLIKTLEDLKNLQI